MSCVLSLAFCIAVLMAASVADLELNMPTLKPPHWYEHASLCCNHELSLRDADEHYADRRMLRECLNRYNGAQYPPCEPDLCFATKKGYASGYDGSIIKDVLQQLLEVEFQDNLVCLEKILADCVYGDLNKYPRLCEIKRLNMCISVHIQQEILRGCHDWKDHSYCLKMRLESGTIVKKYLNTSHAELPTRKKVAPPTRTPSPQRSWTKKNRSH